MIALGPEPAKYDSPRTYKAIVTVPIQGSEMDGLETAFSSSQEHTSKLCQRCKKLARTHAHFGNL